MRELEGSDARGGGGGGRMVYSKQLKHTNIRHGSKRRVRGYRCFLEYSSCVERCSGLSEADRGTLSIFITGLSVLDFVSVKGGTRRSDA